MHTDLPTVLDGPGQSQKRGFRKCPAWQCDIIFGFVPVLKKIEVFYLLCVIEIIFFKKKR